MTLYHRLPNGCPVVRRFLFACSCLFLISLFPLRLGYFASRDANIMHYSLLWIPDFAGVQ